MASSRSTILVEGSFRELAEELADYMDNIRKSQGGADAQGSIKSDVSPGLDNYTQAEEKMAASEAGDGEEAVNDARDAVLDTLVEKVSALSAAPEREFVAAHNLLLHLILPSPSLHKYLQPLCRHLVTFATSTSTSAADHPTTPGVAGAPPTNPATSSPIKLPLALNLLTTIFNVLEPDDGVRYHVFTSILDIISRSPASYESLKPQLQTLSSWLTTWKAPPLQQRRIYTRLSSLARDLGNDASDSYTYLLSAVRTFPASEASSEDARTTAIQALKTALSNPQTFDFEDLTALDAVQSLRNSDASTTAPDAPDSAWFSLLEIFTSEQLDDYDDWKAENPSFLAAAGLDDAVLTRKMRLLTIASVAAQSGQTRTLPYGAIAKALQVPSEDVETWVIDVIRAGLVEGKLSQSRKEFLVHRCSYRVFGENQWREVAGRLDVWRESLMGVLAVVRAEKEGFIRQKEEDLRNAESALRLGSGGQQQGGGGGRGGFGGRRQQQPPQQQQQLQEIEVGGD